MNERSEDFIRLIRHPVKFRVFLFMKLPSAFFAGVRVKEIDQTKCLVKIPYKWFSQNPFRSTYFACLSMAAEMSTGVLAMAHVYKRQPAVSMLVVKVESEYHKKATGITIFTCNSGNEIRQAVEEAIETGVGTSIRVLSTGRNNQGETVSEFWITWSFKAKKFTV
ncbi:MAG: DUF4442 domain-containing protein [Chitinophagaceae bacterium]|nr:DUF4442 domain-containing protein [Chitinophagaceae bacterium]